MRFRALLSALVTTFAIGQDCREPPGPGSPTVEDLLEVARCLTPAVGGVGIRHERPAGPGVPNASRFVLRRPAQGQWDVELHIEITAGNPSDARAAQLMRNRINRCFEQASPFMVGPNGQGLRMRLHDPASPHPDGVVPPLIPINVIAAGERGNATNFASDFDCGTILHEFMHHMGLCDEYRESGSFESAGPCRVVTPSGSLMGQDMSAVYNQVVGAAYGCKGDNLSLLSGMSPAQIEVLTRQGMDDSVEQEPLKSNLSRWCRFSSNVTPRSLPMEEVGRVETQDSGFRVTYWTANLSIAQGEPRLVRQTCACPPGDSTCPGDLRKVEASLRTLYSTEGAARRCPHTTVDIPVPPGSDEVLGATFADGTLRIMNRPSGRSLLHPAHFDRIIRGSCRASDQQTTYDTCARFAYTWSEPPPKAGGCVANVPRECTDSDAILGKPVQIGAR